MVLRVGTSNTDGTWVVFSGCSGIIFGLNFQKEELLKHVYVSFKQILEKMSSTVENFLRSPCIN